MDISRTPPPSSWLKRHWQLTLVITAVAGLMIAASQVEVAAYSAERDNLLKLDDRVVHASVLK